MHPELVKVIRSSEEMRDYVMANRTGDLRTRAAVVKEANAVAANNHIIVGAHAIDLRQRMFESPTMIEQVPDEPEAIEQQRNPRAIEHPRKRQTKA
jgi:hypothetical protein